MITSFDNDTIGYYDSGCEQLRIYSLNYPEWNLIETVPLNERRPQNHSIQETKQCVTCGSYGSNMSCEYCGNKRRTI